MTEQDYVMLAKTIGNLDPRYHNVGEVCKDISDALAKDDRRFDLKEFGTVVNKTFNDRQR